MPVKWPESTDFTFGDFTVDKTGRITDIWLMVGTEQLLEVARAYAAIEGISLSTVSSRAFNDGKKLAAIASGSDIGVRRSERTLQWFSDNWPDGPWPRRILRPRPRTKDAA